MSDMEWLDELGDEVAVGKQPLYTLPLIPPRALLSQLPEPLASLYATGLRAQRQRRQGPIRPGRSGNLTALALHRSSFLGGLGHPGGKNGARGCHQIRPAGQI